MKVNAISGNSPNFGMRCPFEVKQRIMNGLTKEGLPSFFTHAKETAQNIEQIGSQATTLQKFGIYRTKFLDVNDSQISSLADVCKLKFRLNTPSCGSKTVRASIRSVDDDGLNNMFIALSDVTQMVESEFIKQYLEKGAKQGKLKRAAEGLALLYPKHSEEIAELAKKLEVLNAIEHEKRTHMFEKMFYFLKH